MKKQGFLLSSAILIGTMIITKILGLIYKIPLTNLLGGTGMGYYSCAYAIFMPMFAVSVSGISSSMARLVSENAAFERWRNVRKIKRVGMISFSIIGMFFTLLSLALAYPICVYVVKQPAALWSVIAIAPSIIIGAILSVERGYYEGLRNMNPTAISEIIEGIFKIVLGLGLAYKAASITSSSFLANGTVFGIACKTAEEAAMTGLPFIAAASILGVTAANAISCIVLVVVYKFKSDGITKAMLDKDICTDRMRVLLKQLVMLVIPIAIASVITTLTSLVDLVTINKCLEIGISKNYTHFLERFSLSLPSEIEKSNLPNFIYGSYTGLAMTIFGLIPSLTSMFGKSILPAISESWAKKDTKSIGKNIHAVLFATGLIAIPAGLGICVFSEEILRILFPSRTAEILVAYPVLEILSVGMIFLALSAPIFSSLQAIGKAHIPVKVMLVSCIVKVIMNVLLVSIPEINIMGAGISTTIFYIIIFLWSFSSLIKYTLIKINFNLLFVKPFLGAILCCSTAKLTFDILSPRLNSPLSLVISVFLGVIIYIFSLCLLSVLNKNHLKSLFFK